MKPRKDYGCPLRVWDNGGKTADRYTILPPRSQRAAERWLHAGITGEVGWEGLAASAEPFHPQGFGQHITGAQAGQHLGQRITWAELPAAVQRFARASVLGEYCPAEV